MGFSGLISIVGVIIWALVGSPSVARITTDHHSISLTGWGTWFLFSIVCDLALAAYAGRD